MTWREELQRVTMPDGRRLIGASFRGVPFFVESSDRSGGRRTVTHEFPLRDDPTIEDLGRRTRSFGVDGYVIGDDYLVERDALLAALEDSAGPGELVHPYYGVLRAICSSLTVRCSIADGGMARFSLEFTPVPGRTVAPAEENDLDDAALEAADAADATLELELEDSYDVAGQPAFAVDSIADDYSAVSQTMGDALAEVVRDTQELARLHADIQALIGEASSLIRDPVEALGRLRAVLDGIASTVAQAPRSIFRALLTAYAVPIVLVELGTSTREQERANQEAFGAALRRALVIESARVLLDVEHASQEEAAADRDELVALIDEQALTAGNDVYPALMQLRAAVILAVPGDAELARVVTVTRPTATPSLLLSYQLYGDVQEEQAILDRNMSQHPGFLVGDLEVLSDG